MKRFFLQLFGSYLVVIVLLAILFFVSSFNTFKTYYIESTREHLQDLARSISPRVDTYLRGDRKSELQNYVSQIKDRSGNRLTVIQIDGEVLADSDEDPRQMDNHRTRPEVRAARQEGTGSSIRYSRTVETDMLYIAVLTGSTDDPSGVLRVSRYLREITVFNRTLRNRILLISLLLILFPGLVALYFARRFSRPIQQLIQASQDISKGNFSIRVHLDKSRGDLKRLADNFNTMTGDLEHLFSESTKQRLWLKEIMDSISELLVVLDGDNRIMLHNRSFASRFGGEKGRKMDREPYWKILPDRGFAEFINESRAQPGNLTRELVINDLFYICSSSCIPEKNEVIAVLHDITESRNLKIIKKDFVSNVSHEIKTPLTSIKGFVDTLIEEETESKKLEFLEIIKKNTDRLNNIVKDLLILSELEKDDSRLHLSTINLNNLVGEVVKIFKKDIARKRLNLRALFSHDDITIRGDRFKLEQVFINLIDNAVKYTESGGITITADHKGQEVTIRVSDSGIGISERHQQRIFERFFVVDKSRSRRSGGTGLGLSIVKHIVLQHHGTITVSSNLNEGTAFEIILPTHSESENLTEN